MRWEGDGSIELAHHCHCSICRRSHGTAFGSFGGLAAQTFQLHASAERLIAFETSPGSTRRFCAHCGAPLPTHPIDGQVYVPLGQLEDDPRTKPLAHIFVASKADWYEISDALPQFDAFPPGFDAPVVPDPETEPAPPGVVRGRCQCAAVAYELAGPVRAFRHCHCSRCRRARGAAHASNLFGAASDFRWLRGEDRLAAYKPPDAERFTQTFCRTCGGKLPSVNAALGYVTIPAGSLDTPPGASPEGHIFVGSKAPWFDITDALPRHDELPPS